MYRFNARSTPETAYVYVCLGGAHHVHADPRTRRADQVPVVASPERRTRILEHRPLRAGGFAIA